VTPGASPPGWHTARRELSVAAGLGVALTVGTWLLLGAPAAAVIALSCTGLALFGLRLLLDPHQREPAPAEPPADQPSTTFAGFWRTQSDLADATVSLTAFDLNARRRLTNLLAARLAERHGVSLTADPQAARAIFFSAAAGAGRRVPPAELWYWIDPERPSPERGSSIPGIPPRVLAALIYRLEQL